MIIDPTVARMLWYRVAVGDIVPSLGDQPCAAILAGVVSADRVNLAVFGADGSGPYAKQNVYLEQVEAEPAPGACCWMPFQKGQAVKVEADLPALVAAAVAEHLAELEAERVIKLAKLKSGEAHLVERADGKGFDIEDIKPAAVPEINGAPTAAQGENVATEPQPANQAEPAEQA